MHTKGVGKSEPKTPKSEVQGSSGPPVEAPKVEAPKGKTKIPKLNTGARNKAVDGLRKGAKQLESQTDQRAVQDVGHGGKSVAKSPAFLRVQRPEVEPESPKAKPRPDSSPSKSTGQKPKARSGSSPGKLASPAPKPSVPDAPPLDLSPPIPPPPGPPSLGGPPPIPGPPGPPSLGGPPPLLGAPGPKKPAPTGEYLSKAFKSELKPEHLAASGLPRERLGDLTTLFNYAMKLAKVAGQGDSLVDGMLAKGGPLAGMSKTSQLAEALGKNPDLLSELTQSVWTTVKGEAPMPTVRQLEALQVELNKPKDMGPYVGATQSKNVRVSDWKDVSITPAALKKANKELAAANSFLRLEAVGDPVDGFVKIKPRWEQGRAVTAEHAESHAPLAKLNQGSPSYISWADCHRTAQTIMGSEDFNSGISDKEHVKVGGEFLAPIPKAKIKEIPAATDHGANRAMHAMFQKAMPEFAKALRAEIKDRGPNPGYEAIIKAIETATPKDGSPGNYRNVYRMIMDDKSVPSLAKMFADQFGLNESAKPRVGEAFAQINDEFEKATSSKDLWNFHFAGVVLTDGDSYLTLENLSVEDTNATNQGWYFRMYDKEKNFHAMNRTDDHVGDYPTTMLFKAV